MAVKCEGILMYDPRHAVKARAAEAIDIGESVYISSNGLANVIDNGKQSPVHGFALESAAEGDNLTIVKWCRMKVDTIQTIGARVYAGNISGGSAPSTTLSNTIVGFAYEAYKIAVWVPMPAADG